MLIIWQPLRPMLCTATINKVFVLLLMHFFKSHYIQDFITDTHYMNSDEILSALSCNVTHRWLLTFIEYFQLMVWKHSENSRALTSFLSCDIPMGVSYMLTSRTAKCPAHFTFIPFLNFCVFQPYSCEIMCSWRLVNIFYSLF